MPAEREPEAAGLAIPLSRWASRQLQQLAALAGSPRIAALDGAGLLGERAALGGFTIGGKISAGPGSTRLLPTADGDWFALTLARPDDRELLPALLGEADIAIADDAAIARAIARRPCADLLTTGRTLGLAVAGVHEQPAAPPECVLARGPHRRRPPGHRPRVIDLSALWAGPLAGHLLWLAGAEVIKVESLGRPDGMREGDPALFALLNQGKASVAVDLGRPAGREALLDLLRGADIVLESSRPRALLQLGIDAAALVREVPGLVWVSITGHGALGEPAQWTGMGNDCAVAAGLSAALARASGTIGFVGDALADPLTGIVAALAAWRGYKHGEARRVALAMSGVAAAALREERDHDAAALQAELRAWGRAVGQPFPPVARRKLEAATAPLGADTARWLAGGPPC